jgi:hypothetical protein
MGGYYCLFQEILYAFYICNATRDATEKVVFQDTPGFRGTTPHPDAAELLPPLSGGELKGASGRNLTHQGLYWNEV